MGFHIRDERRSFGLSKEAALISLLTASKLKVFVSIFIYNYITISWIITVLNCNAILLRIYPGFGPTVYCVMKQIFLYYLQAAYEHSVD